MACSPKTWNVKFCKKSILILEWYKNNYDQLHKVYFIYFPLYEPWGIFSTKANYSLLCWARGGGGAIISLYTLFSSLVSRLVFVNNMLEGLLVKISEIVCENKLKRAGALNCCPNFILRRISYCEIYHYHSYTVSSDNILISDCKRHNLMYNVNQDMLCIIIYCSCFKEMTF